VYETGSLTDFLNPNNGYIAGRSSGAETLGAAAAAARSAVLRTAQQTRRHRRSHGDLLIKGRHWVGTVRAQNGSARVEAFEVRDTHNSDRATGVLITFLPADANSRADEIRSMIDYEEIDGLVKMVDTMIKADDNVTKLSHFEERYRTRGDFEVMVFKQQTGTSVAAAIEGGFFDRLRLFMIMDDLIKFRYMIVQAKERLDEIK
jgi:hypothetical protein